MIHVRFTPSVESMPRLEFEKIKAAVDRAKPAQIHASYGAVTEPCNYPRKFPHPCVVIGRYPAGETMIEAYRKSMAWPGQGVFTGEPLAAPFRYQLNHSWEADA